MSDAGGGWTCPACTFINSASSVAACEVCETPAPGAAPAPPPPPAPDVLRVARSGGGGRGSSGGGFSLAHSFVAAGGPAGGAGAPAVAEVRAAAVEGDVALLRRLVMRAARGRGRVDRAALESLQADDTMSYTWDSPVLNVLHAAAAAGQLAACVLLVGEFGFSLRATTTARGTALHFAARGGHGAVVRYLLTYVEDGLLDVNKQVESYGNDTALTLAAAGGHETVVRDLLAAGAHPNVCDAEPRAPLQYAVQAGSVGSVTALLAAGAAPGLALRDAISSRNSDIITLLLTAAAAPAPAAADDPHEEEHGHVEHMGHTGWFEGTRAALSTADSPAELETLGLPQLLAIATSSGGSIDVNEHVRYRGTPLHVAVRECKGADVCTEAVRLLLAAGADPNAPSSTFGKTPLELARANAALAPVTALLEGAVAAAASTGADA